MPRHLTDIFLSVVVLLPLLLSTAALAYTQAPFERHCMECLFSEDSSPRLSEYSSQQMPSYTDRISQYLSLSSDKRHSRSCRICWLSLLILEPEILGHAETNYDRLGSHKKIKKAMMNNGWA